MRPLRKEAQNHLDAGPVCWEGQIFSVTNGLFYLATGVSETDEDRHTGRIRDTYEKEIRCKVCDAASYMK